MQEGKCVHALCVAAYERTRVCSGEDERKCKCLRLCVRETTYRMALSVWVCDRRRGSQGRDTRQRERQIAVHGKSVRVCVCV